MKYALLIYDEPGTYEALSPQEYEGVSEEYFAVSRLPDCVGGEQLQGATAATTVRINDGQMVTTDGPFADTKEVLGGFFLLEADNLDRALEVAAKIPASRLGGSVEVRPIVERQS